MAIKALFCPQCGGKVELDDSKEHGFCMFCGTKILVTQDIINYNNTIYNTTNQTIQNQTVINKMGDKAEKAKESISNGETFLSLKKYNNAIDAFEKAVEADPSNYRGWLGIFTAGTADLAKLDLKYNDYLKNAISLAPPEQKTEIERKYGWLLRLPDATTVTFPNSITTIDSFAGCKNLTSITIPNFVTTITSRMFRDCTSLKSIIIPNSVTKIESQAFCFLPNLTSIVIPNSVKSLGTHLFTGCTNLKEITLPFAGENLKDTHVCNTRLFGGIQGFNNECEYSLETITIANIAADMYNGSFLDKSTNLKKLRTINLLGDAEVKISWNIFHGLNKNITIYMSKRLYKNNKDNLRNVGAAIKYL